MLQRIFHWQWAWIGIPILWGASLAFWGMDMKPAGVVFLFLSYGWIILWIWYSPLPQLGHRTRVPSRTFLGVCMAMAICLLATTGVAAQCVSMWMVVKPEFKSSHDLTLSRSWRMKLLLNSYSVFQK